MVAQERISVHEAVGRKNKKVNLFSMYFIRTKEEIHLSFKNSENKRTQALSLTFVPHMALSEIISDYFSMWPNCF